MGGYNRYGKATVDPGNLKAQSVCDRCGQWHNLCNLKWQFQWNATQLYNTRLLVCDDCYDKPQEQLRAVILPPDPPPLYNIRPEFFEADEVDYLSTQDGNHLITQDNQNIVADQASENFSQSPPQVPPVTNDQQ